VIGIYTGRIANWREVGGLDAPITVITKAEGRSTLELFLEHFGLKNPEVRAQVVIGDNQQEIKTLQGNPDAIGYVSVGAAEFEAGQGTPIRLLPMEGIPATADNVREGRFPLSRPLNLVTRETPTGLARDFIDFARSPQADSIVRAQYFVPIAH
jgi:phosphate transport system substrate-binding protein